MTVIMKGGTSGNREDAIVSMPGFDSQALQNTANNGSHPGVNIVLGTAYGGLAPMPTGGTPNDSAT